MGVVRGLFLGFNFQRSRLNGVRDVGVEICLFPLFWLLYTGGRTTIPALITVQLLQYRNLVSVGLRIVSRNGMELCRERSDSKSELHAVYISIISIS